MREIKFRGLGVDGEWWYGEREAQGKNCNSLATFFDNLRAGAIKPKTVGECTGLKDSYAVEEYFDDIIEEEDGTRRVIEDGCSAVLFKNPKVKYGIKYFWELLGTHKVIGNIYENAELLEDATEE